ncbi:aldehyde dehydrogenase family protein [Paracoccus sp. S-4012]|uniref:aldehyde dehydrogenase family protein n=1 Tax=Paracoccus sp. S-4012 TaxID=2665648 RepID=UPI0012AF438C|nr:aldehyde dehydrogenase family protein [Paracoccus sp. S-4012]MRX51919.1 aldehyde dehydrogenase family protein [Paracoccus sp. S-4012]
MTIRQILDSLDYGPSPESSEAVQAWLDSHREGFGQFIDGRFTPHEAEGAIPVENPATHAALPSVSAGTAADVEAAVAAARAALPAWQRQTPQTRARYLYALARAVQKRERFLSVLETIDNGKPIRESRDIDIPLVARHFHYHAGMAANIEALFPGHEPVGVCAQVIPWNFPLLMLSWKVAPALAAGNTVVLKPAEQTPLTALAFAEICTEVGLPPGVLNIVTGAGETGAALVAHEGVDKVAFTGSTEVGRAIRRATAGQGKSLTLELGGKSPFVVFADADLEAAVEGVVDGIWFNGGQVCCAGSRLFVQEGIAERFQERLKERLATLRVGDPLDKSTDIGAIVSAEQHSRIADLLATGAAEGAVLHSAPGDLPGTGHFHAPGFVTGAHSASTLQTVEIFGPVATLTTFRTPAEAAELANNTAYGLAASVWSQNLDVAMDLAAKVRAGVVWINGTNMFDAAAPFGGMKESGFGREGGAAGMRAYLRESGAEAPPEPQARVDFAPAPVAEAARAGNSEPALDRTLKLYVGGRQVRADGGGSYALRGSGGVFGAAALGNRKDIRNAVEAAVKAQGWSAQAGHNRSQVVWFMAENMARRRETFAHALTLTGSAEAAALAEADAAIDRLTQLAGLADKLAGAVQSTRARHVTLAMNEPRGVVGLVCPEAQPLLGMVTLIGALIAMGNRVVAVPSPDQAWLAGDFAQLCDSSDVPGGVVNLISGDPAELAPVLALHDEVDALWHQGASALTRRLEEASAGNLKPVRRHGVADWAALPPARLLRLAEEAQQVKTIWVPYGA